MSSAPSFWRRRVPTSGEGVPRGFVVRRGRVSRCTLTRYALAPLRASRLDTSRTENGRGKGGEEICRSPPAPSHSANYRWWDSPVHKYAFKYKGPRTGFTYEPNLCYCVLRAEAPMHVEGRGPLGSIRKMGKSEGETNNTLQDKLTIIGVYRVGLRTRKHHVSRNTGSPKPKRVRFNVARGLLIIIGIVDVPTFCYHGLQNCAGNWFKNNRA